MLPNRADDLTGNRYGRLVVKSYNGFVGSYRKLSWYCKCDCGKFLSVIGTNLKSGNTQSCGCYYEESRKSCHKTHGKEDSVEYAAWLRMKNRCYNSKTTAYNNYGGRGIIVCDRWRNSFENFLEDMGSRPSYDHSLDRINNDGNYEPSNCRWATRTEQARNRRTTRFCIYKGERMSIGEACERSGLNYEKVYYRIEVKGMRRYKSIYKEDNIDIEDAS